MFEGEEIRPNEMNVEFFKNVRTISPDRVITVLSNDSGAGEKLIRLRGRKSVRTR